MNMEFRTCMTHTIDKTGGDKEVSLLFISHFVFVILFYFVLFLYEPTYIYFVLASIISFYLNFVYSHQYN